ncbi:hypothetical protein [Rhodococcus rhodnii]|uniref:hypothetical protein n=1 Tax=Rhodococcus rhodnii TaxID=38312 RepID=UPI000593DC07|nr:hypothetical protein [Rhodococcus rhodnii]
MSSEGGRWPLWWPDRALEIADGIVEAAERAAAGDAEGFEDEITGMAALPHGQPVTALSGIVTELFEAAHPDGIGADDVRAILERTVAGAQWYRGDLVGPLVVVLTGALGSAPEDAPPVPEFERIAAAVLAAATLASRARVPLTVVVRSALAEIARAETVESP